MALSGGLSDPRDRRRRIGRFTGGGRRSYTTSIAFGPSLGRNIALSYLPREYCEVGRELVLEYFNEPDPIKVEAVGYAPLYDPQTSSHGREGRRASAGARQRRCCTTLTRRSQSHGPRFGADQRGLCNDTLTR